ncbi:PI-PLC X domain-containing protein 1-like isoform X2 [Zophobas morio]|uniref:PI-PLC X domain-containing protein 1-like isoform X2 n=1 Tax=Zophobas morio TaxID=2755281 RepID=UPI003083413F
MLLVPLILFLQIADQANSQTQKENTNPCGQLYLTQSPNKKKNIQLNWNFNCDDPPDTILLTLNDIRTNPNAQVLYTILPRSVFRGYHETPFTLKDAPFPGNWTEDNSNPDLNAGCFDYYIASAKGDKIIHSQCLSIQPTWMSNFGDLRIGDLMIPGTHNSGAWKGAPLLIRNYVLNQDKSIWQQLVYGIRYFDIRVGRYGNTSDGLYINHAFIKCTELLPELQSAATFIRKSPKEVIILDFHRFPYPNDFKIQYHNEVVRMIQSVFGDLIYPFYRMTHTRGPKLKEFWLTKQRVVIAHRNKEMSRVATFLWPSVARDWGDVQKVQDLETYVKYVSESAAPGNPMRVLMAELTPSYVSVLKHVTRNLKDLAVMVNRELSDWVRQNNRSANLNIVATDFFTGNDIINVAIESNFKRLTNFYT